MPRIPTPRPIGRHLAALLALPLAIMAPVAALAHHGFNWADAGLTQITGTVEAVSMAAPHPTLTVVDANGDRWTIELANPGKTERSGFTAGAAPQGSSVDIIGNRDKDSARNRMKAVRITIDGRQTFDIYPERIPEGAPD